VVKVLESSSYLSITFTVTVELLLGISIFGGCFGETNGEDIVFDLVQGL
jgi:hypothetical protein